jgi:anaerobic sulfite reductase subunit B
MLQLTPQTIRIVQTYDDGLSARHFTFEPVNFAHTDVINLGQFFMLSVPGAGLAPFTYTSLPDNHGRFNALVRNVGKLTNALFCLKSGDTLGYNGPFGNGWPQNKLDKGDILIVAGGCGLAPLAATIDYLINHDRGKHVTLIYGSRDVESQVLYQQRSAWRSAITLFETLNENGDPDHSGTVTQHIQPVLNERQKMPDTVFTCGPEAMMNATAKICMEMGISSDNIWCSIERRMRCGVGLCGHCYVANSYACTQGPTYRYDELVALENKTVSVAPHMGAFQYC